MFISYTDKVTFTVVLYSLSSNIFASRNFEKSMHSLAHFYVIIKNALSLNSYKGCILGDAIYCQCDKYILPNIKHFSSAAHLIYEKYLLHNLTDKANLQ